MSYALPPRAKELKYYEYKRALQKKSDSDDADAEPLVPAEPLTEEEEALREALKAEGFEKWSKRDFNAFVRGCELWGRHDLASVTQEVEGKTEREVAKVRV